MDDSMNVQKQRYIIVIETMKDSLLESHSTLVSNYPEYEGVKFLLLSKNDQAIDSTSDKVDVLITDYTRGNLDAIFNELNGKIIAVLCRGDKYVQYLRRILPYLPDSVPVSSDASLEVTTNKRLMRQAFSAYAPEITPKYLKVLDGNQSTISDVSSSLKFPVIVKPASLASSLMIQRCNDEESLGKTLNEVFSSLDKIYKSEGRSEKPEVIVEEFLIGEFYSIDAYVMKKNDIYYAPIIEYLPAESMGINDFFLYKRWTSVELSSEEEAAAQLVVKKSIIAAGLEHSSVHAELVRTKDGWKIIEIGPRIGRFRNTMYKLAFDFDHGYNDLLIHLGIKPNIKKITNNYVAAYSVYPHQEGKLNKVQGIDIIEQAIKTINYLDVSNLHIGEEVYAARNGGHALVEVVFSCPTYVEYDNACKWFDKNVYAAVEGKQ